MKPFKLSAELYGHSKDVRAVAESFFPSPNGIVSGSRDETMRVWNLDESGRYIEKHRTRGHEGFVTSVASARTDPNSLNGIVFCGSQDGKISAYQVGQSLDLMYRLEGHTGAVCALAVDNDTLVSGSWDATARVWRGQECVAELKGHSYTVWAVAVIPSPPDISGERNQGDGQKILTGSADRKIILWSMGKAEKTYEGHSDCVRALAMLNDSEFLSASNDTTVRKWNLYTGECLMTYHGHENFIYSMSVIPTNPEYFVTSSEDGTVKIWNSTTGENVQTLLLPTQTIWSVRCLSNGDIVVGSADGIIRIFSADPKRQADPDMIAAYDSTVQQFFGSLNSKDEIGGYKIADLPGKEALNEPGKKDGATKMVRVGQKVELHKWSGETGQWEKVGDVMGAAKPADGKSMHEGKEFDYVFDVDIEDGRPPLKLPYNVNEDPWLAAQRFLEHNMLPMSYIDQVVQFIRTNAPNAGKGAPPAEFSDPFTGGGRYVPGSGSKNGVQFNDGGGDPLTAGGRYRPGEGVGSSAPPADRSLIDPKRPRGEHMPLTDYVTFTAVSADSLLAKLMEFNGKQTDANHRLTDEQILLLEEFTAKAGSQHVKCSDAHLKAVERILQWHKDYLVPVLDIFRLVVLNESANNFFFNNSKLARGLETVDRLCRLIATTDSPPQFQILVCRAFANAIAGGESGRRLLISKECSSAVTPLIVQCLDSAKPAAQVAAATALANISCAYLKAGGDMVNVKVDSFRLIVEKLKSVRQGVDYGSLDQETLFRLLQAIVTFMWGDDAAMAVGRAMKLGHLVSRFKDATNEEKSKAIARSIERMISL